MREGKKAESPLIFATDLPFFLAGRDETQLSVRQPTSKKECEIARKSVG